tara:strand:+ start:225 stop:449 length:225 start_codon:yes stop_codon:yes gene_type:complete
MKKDTQQLMMYIALGAGIATLVLYLTGQLKFVEFLEGEKGDEDEYDSEDEGMDGEPLPMGESDSDSDSDSEDEE